MPITIEEAMQTALGHHQAGRLDAAEAVYRQVLDHPATSGLDTMGYRLTDPYIDPPGATDAD